MQKVLIALDYGPTAKEVADGGYMLAKEMNAEITLLHVAMDVPYYSSLEFSPVMGYVGFMNLDTMISDEEIKRRALEFLDKSRDYLGSKTIELIVKQGDTPEMILQAAKELESDIIVIGSHSRKWLDKILMGSVTEKLMDESRVPLYIIPTKQKK